MKPEYENNLRSLLFNGETEDPERELKLANYHLDISPTPEVQFQKIVDGLKKNIPLPRILGYTLVAGIPITINGSVLHPGPETLKLIDEALKYIQVCEVRDVLELCTGSGAIAIVLASTCPNLRITATDISQDALEIAKANAEANSVCVDFRRGNLFKPVANKKFDAIICNPPYVKTGEINNLPTFVRDFSPRISIDGGLDGFHFHRLIITRAKKHLRKKCPLFLECEDGQDNGIVKLATANGFRVDEKYPNKHGQIRSFKLTPIS